MNIHLPSLLLLQLKHKFNYIHSYRGEKEKKKYIHIIIILKLKDDFKTKTSWYLTYVFVIVFVFSFFFSFLHATRVICYFHILISISGPFSHHLSVLAMLINRNHYQHVDINFIHRHLQRGKQSKVICHQHST